MMGTGYDIIIARAFGIEFDTHENDFQFFFFFVFFLISFNFLFLSLRVNDDAFACVLICSVITPDGFFLVSFYFPVCFDLG